MIFFTKLANFRRRQLTVVNGPAFPRDRELEPSADAVVLRSLAWFSTGAVSEG